MLKKCSQCGSEMNIMLRQLVYRHRVNIYNVPILVCSDDTCTHSQVFEGIKGKLQKLVHDLGHNPNRQEIHFEEMSEFTNLLIMVADEQDNCDVSKLVDERVNDLLDMFLLAQSLGDEKWEGELRKRLLEIVH